MLIAVPARRMQSKLPIRLMAMTFLNASRFAAESYEPSLPTVRCAQPMPAELTSTRTGPIDFAISTASTMSSVLGDVDPGERATDLGRPAASPLSSCRSATTTLAPCAASSRADGRADPGGATRDDRACTRDVHGRRRYRPRPAPIQATSRPSGGLTASSLRSSMASEHSPATRAITSGRAQQGSSLTPPLWGTSTWQSSGLDDTRKRATGTRADEFYSRYANPTVRAFEEAVADLEGAEDALAFASGMGAIASVVFALCSSGDHIVAQRQIYAGTSALLLGPCARMGIEVTWVDGTTPGRVRRGGAAGTHDARRRRVAVEPTPRPRRPRRPRRRRRAVHDRRLHVRHADRGPADPQRRRPRRALGHQGHLRAQRRHARRGRRASATCSTAIWTYAVLHGACASPFDALNGLRGIRTLAVRQRQAAASALRPRRRPGAPPGRERRAPPRLSRPPAARAGDAASSR